MPQLSISQVARQIGLRPSAIRYYEQLGLLPPAMRTSGQRRYDRSVLYRLAVLQRARQAGFSLDEIRALFFGFPEGTRAEARWQRLAESKIFELDNMIGQIREMQNVLKKMKAKCHCNTLEACGKGIFESGEFKVEGGVLRTRKK